VNQDRAGGMPVARLSSVRLVFDRGTTLLLQLIHRVEAAALDETLGEAEGHRRVVRPCASREIERAAAHDVGDGRKRAGAPELECRPERIAGGEAEEDPAVVCDHVGNGHVHTNCVMYARSGLRA